jgi:hypothetical protein
MDNFCLSCENSYTGLPGEVVYEGDPGFSKREYLYPGNKGDFQPRINFAWSPSTDRKMVIRGGYDLFYTPATDSNNYSSQFTLPGWNSYGSWQLSEDPNQCPNYSGCVAWSLDDTSTNKYSLLFPTPQLSALTRNPMAQGFSSFELKQNHDPMVQEWSLQVERQLPGNAMVSVGYVGTAGTHLFGDPWRNYAYVHTADRIKYKNSIYNEVPITSVYSGQTATALQQFYGSSELPLSMLLNTYPFWQGLPALAGYDGRNIYQGLNIRVQKKYAHGLDFAVAYTNSKNITNAQTADLGSYLVDPIHTYENPGGRGNFTVHGYNPQYQDPDNIKDRMLSVEDIPQMLNITAAYELPVGKGKALLNQGGPLNHILGGWKLVGNFNAESGIPLQVTCPGDALTSRCDLIGNPNAVPGGQNASHWINAGAFQPPFGGDQTFWANYNPNDPRAYQLGTAGLVLGNLRSPGSSNLDTSLTKKFSLSESKYFEFRWELFNTLNHMNLALPNTGFCLPAGPNGQTDLVHQAGCSFGRITNIGTDPRAMEFGLKFYY